ncbi:hypothetical protein ACI65C_006895 [Semiaphis heraclei]
MDLLATCLTSLLASASEDTEVCDQRQFNPPRRTFTSRQTLVSGDISWRCVKKTCSAYVKTNSSKTKLTEIKDSHTHNPETEENLNLLDVQGRANLSRRAIEGFCGLFSDQCVGMFKTNFVLSEG